MTTDEMFMPMKRDESSNGVDYGARRVGDGKGLISVHTLKITFCGEHRNGCPLRPKLRD